MPMKVLLVRHGDAKRATEDHERPLSDRGIKEIECVAVFVGKSGLRVSEIRHSGKKRAEQTADIFNKHITSTKGITTIPGLSPNADVEPIADMLKAEEKSIMLVGHLPHLSHLASLLLIKKIDRELIQFTTGTTVCLSRDYSSWTIEWIISPRMIIQK